MACIGSWGVQQGFDLIVIEISNKFYSSALSGYSVDLPTLLKYQRLSLLDESHKRFNAHKPGITCTSAVPTDLFEVLAEAGNSTGV